SLSFERAEIAVEAGPVVRDPEPFDGRLVRRFLRPQRRRAALADDLGRDALPDVALASAVGQQRHARLTLNIDESRRDPAAGRINLRTCTAFDRADRDDAIALDSDVGPSRRSARPVDDVAVPDDDVV